MTKTPITQWMPLTLQGAGLFHIAMGAVLGLAAWGRTQEKLSGANNGGLSTAMPTTPLSPAAANLSSQTSSLSPAAANLSSQTSSLSPAAANLSSDSDDMLPRPRRPVL